jgi:hypothetical protein
MSDANSASALAHRGASLHLSNHRKRQPTSPTAGVVTHCGRPVLVIDLRLNRPFKPSGSARTVLNALALCVMSS